MFAGSADQRPHRLPTKRALMAGAADGTFQFKISAVDSNVNALSRYDDAAQSQSDPRDGERRN